MAQWRELLTSQLNVPVLGWLRLACLVAGVLLLFILILAIVCLLTGNVLRGYSTLPPFAAVVVAGRTISLDQLASMFQPQLFLPTGANSPPILTMWWEAIDAGSSIALVYHPVWQDELHPKPVFHLIYYIYRAIVYGTPVRDIEYIQININRLDGSVQRIRYEGSSSQSYDDWFAEHIPTTIDRADMQYVETTMQNKESNIRTLRLRSGHLRFGIATWSHQFVLLEDDSERYIIPVNVSIENLTEENYSKYKLARRSQGDFATREGAISRAAKSAMGVLILGLPYLFRNFRT